MFPVKFVWKREWGGTDVQVTGEYNQWQRRDRLQPNPDGDLSVVVLLPLGTFMVKYVVDADWRLAPNQPTKSDNAGNVNNVVVVDKAQYRQANHNQPNHNHVNHNQANHHQASPRQPVQPAPANTPPPSRSSLYRVVKYTEHPNQDPEEGVARLFDVEVVLEPNNKANDDLPRVSSMTLLVDLTLQQVTAADPGMSGVADQIRDRIVCSLKEQTRMRLLHVKHQLKTPEERAVCLNVGDTHPDIELDLTGLVATKVTPGMYRSARAVHALLQNRQCYFEVVFNAQCNSGGICVGLSSPQSLPLANLVGIQTGSIGLYSSGDVVVEGEWRNYAPSFGEGDVVGVLATLVPTHSGSQRLQCSFLVNGHDHGAVANSIVVPSHMALHPTVTLYSTKTRVTLQATPVDLRYGDALARRGVRAFSLDGHPLVEGAVGPERSLPPPLCGR